MKIAELIFEASIILDKDDFDDADFQSFLKENNIKAKKVEAATVKGSAPEYTFYGSKSSLSKMIDQHFDDDHLKTYIKENLEDTLLTEAQWSGEVKTKVHPPEGLFAKGSAGKIAKWAKGAHKNLKGAMAALNYFVNRAGKKLSAERRDTIDQAKKLLKPVKEEK